MNVELMLLVKFSLYLLLLVLATFQHSFYRDNRNRQIRENREEKYSLIISKAPISHKYIELGSCDETLWFWRGIEQAC